MGSVCCQVWFHLTAAAAGRPDGAGGRVARVGPASPRISHTRVSGSSFRSDVKEVCRAKSSIRYGAVNPSIAPNSHVRPLGNNLFTCCSSQLVADLNWSIDTHVMLNVSEDFR